MATRPRRRVMGFGTFDGLHPGHESFLRQLRALGDEVFVVVARDANVAKAKGRPPERTEKERARALAPWADRVILGDPHDFYRPLRTHKPNVIGLGYDQRADEARIRETLPAAEIVRLKPYAPEKYKSSLLARRP